MRLKDLQHEDYVQYKKPSMFLGTCFCDFKCQKEFGPECHCQNSPAYAKKIHDCSNEHILDLYLKNPLTKALVIGGFEPLLQFDELIELIEVFRKATDDDIVIYTGYREDEIQDKIEKLKTYKNIILKVGRYIPNAEPVKDEVLGVTLASFNQYGIKL